MKKILLGVALSFFLVGNASAEVWLDNILVGIGWSNGGAVISSGHGYGHGYGHRRWGYAPNYYGGHGHFANSHHDNYDYRYSNCGGNRGCDLNVPGHHHD